MATVYVGSARSDENGKAYNGKAGDQKSGKEVSTQAWYKHSKGWRVFRAKDPAHAAKIAEVMKWACGTNLIGYDQWQRHTLYKELQKNGFKSLALSKAVETDCSALVRVCIAFCGINVPEEFRTGNMPKYLLNSGEFVELKGSKYTDQSAYLGAGDILVTKTNGHTVVATSTGDKYEGVASVIVPVKKFGVDILREGDEGEAVKLMQEYLDRLGYDLGSSGIDGDFGPKTEGALKAFQKDQKLNVDGEFGPKSHEAMMAAIDKLNETPTVPSASPDDLTVKPGEWRIRTGPGTAYPTAGFVDGGDKLTKIDLGKWVPVLFGSEVRFISKEALEG